MWVMPGIECCARGSKGGSGHFPDTRAHSDHGIHGADMETHVTSTQPALTCQMRSNYERILRTLDWAYHSWLMSSCQGRVRVISSKAQSSADVYIFSVAAADYKKPWLGLWLRGPGPWPGARNARIMQITLSPRVCVNMCTVCNISSYPRLCLTPSIHSLWPVWGLSKQTPALFRTSSIIRAPRVILRSFLSDTDISRGQHTRIYFLPSVCVWHRPSLCPTKRFLWRTKSWVGVRGQWLLHGPGEREGSLPGLQTRIVNARAISTDFLRFNRMDSDDPCHGSWQRQQQYAGIVPGPGRGGWVFFLWRAAMNVITQCRVTSPIWRHTLPAHSWRCLLMISDNHHSPHSQDINN